ncbi:hypothetical protein [Proteiniphilum sp.]|uniref:hypothetical protein n=1 Tax=Proteiniphilum sp. TaxID=1926877 RepID=UPI002B1E97F2|nr:hypothetical protein [Proteiniphilum sp.]MEA4917394.1 hypothetical protein [Proteiniphilum sp.]
MKKISIILTVAGLLLFHSCNKEELVTINEPLELDENSRRYQEYLAERAINFIQLYRFDKLGDLMDRIIDPQIKAKVEAIYKEYRTRAENDAWYFVTPANDTLYFLPSVAKDAVQARINFEPSFWDLQNQRNIINAEGVLHGFKNNPKIQSFSMLNSLATGLKGLEGMPDMTLFDWDIQTHVMIERYPDRELSPVKLQADFSKNSKLEVIQLQFVDITEMIFPSHKLAQWFSVSNGVINSNLNNVSADKIGAGGVSTDSEITLTNSVRDFRLSLSGLKKLNLKDLKDLELISLGLPDCEELTLPDGITNEILTNSRSIASWSAPIRVKSGCIIHNAPDGIEEHVTYY